MTNGILIVNKKKGVTSRDVVNKVGKILHTKKIGHTGTLDPIATGVLVLTIGKATKLTDFLTSTYKEYIAKVELGTETDTLDNTGTILKEEQVVCSKEQIETILFSFLGAYEQEVPKYSAVKVNGKKLYEYARNKEEVVLPKREVTIKEIQLLNYQIKENKTYFTFRCLVSKGTYIRSLIRDIAGKLNTVGIMTNLQRTKQGKFGIEQSYLEADIEMGNYQILPFEEILKDYKMVSVSEEQALKIKNGQFFENLYGEEYIVFKQKEVLAIYKNENGILKPYKMLF